MRSNLLAVGDILLLLSDGLSEHAGGSYFPAQAEKLLAEIADESAEEICRRLKEDLLRAGKPEDDITVVAIKKTE